MIVLLYILSVLSFISGLTTGVGATTIFQQVVSAISFVTASILLGSAATVDAIEKLRKEIKQKVSG